MKSLLWHTPIVLKQMIRLRALILAGCVVCAGLVLIEFGSISNHRPSSGARLPPAEIEPAAPETRKLADALLSPKQRHPGTPSSANDADSQLRDVRLTGVVIGPDLRIAIFAVTGASPLMLSEGDILKDWRLESISLERVVLSGPAGNIVLEPKPDVNLVRPPPPAAVQSRPLEPDIPLGAAPAGAPQQPMVVTPIAIGNLSAPTPVQTQGYPYYFPEYSGGYDQYYPSYDYYPFPWYAGYPWGWGWGAPWGWGWPIGVSAAFGGCVNCRFRPGFVHPGFARSGFFRTGFSSFGHTGFGQMGLRGGFSGGFHGGRR